MPVIKNKLIIKKDYSHDIVIQKGLIAKASNFLNKFKGKYSQFCIITDYNLEKLYGKKLLADLKKAGFKVELFSIPAGENTKSRSVKGKIEDLLIEREYGRDSALIALGGGVIGDLAGFIAGTYCRGIGLIQIPTSLLSMVDAGIGGKTAISTRLAKNIIGVFHHPEIVLIDPEVLKTLPQIELQNGLAEVIKTALIMDKKLFKYLEENFEAIQKYNLKHLTYIVQACADLKRQIVAKDPHEENLRKILNYGHTAGHAIETLSDYKKTHGECVAMGMVIAGELATQEKIFSEKDLKRQNDLIKKLNFTWSLPQDITTKNILKTMKVDKKSKNKEPEFVFLEKIGKVYREKDNYTHKITLKKIEKIINNNLK